MLGVPNADYDPETTGDGTEGGLARIATVIKQVRGAKSNPVLLLDAGDFTMGTLFHLLRGEAEMGLMNELGYDATCLGNHEFDLLPTGVADIVTHRGSIPVLASNLEVRDPGHPWGAAMQAKIDSGDIVETAVQTLDNGIKVGYFGIMGEDAWRDVYRPYDYVDPELYPVWTLDRFDQAELAVKELRNNQGVDIVICLSHSGVDKDDHSLGEDPDLALELAARGVPIDVIISGHTHTDMDPVVKGGAVIVQASAYTRKLGQLEMEYDPVQEEWSFVSYQSYLINDTIPGDQDTQDLIKGYIARINADVLPSPYTVEGPIAETAFDLEEPSPYAQEHGLGNLITDAIRWSVEEVTEDYVDVAIEAGGVIRAGIKQGATGVVQTSDAFRVVPLGIDHLTEEAGYPLLSFCMYGSDLSDIAWVNALAPYVDDSELWLSWSGMGFKYIDYLPPLSMWQCNDAGDPDCVDRTPIDKNQLYRVAVNYYAASNVGRLEELSGGLIKVYPRECSTGDPLDSLDQAIVYEDLAKTDPLTQWEGFLDFLHFGLVGTIPARYAGPEGRMIKSCVVATAAYGSPLEEKVVILRDFRDKILMKSQMGRSFVEFYYAHGLPVADAVAQSEWLRALVRILLLPLVGAAKLLLWVL
jgi:5'-nucleotidase